MAVYRGEKRRGRQRVILISLIVLVVIVLFFLGRIFGLFGKGELSPQEKRQVISQEIEEITQGVEVFIISHYTEEVVEQGKVKLPREYTAAKENIEQLKNRFKEIEKELGSEDPEVTRKIGEGFDQIVKATEEIKAPKEVSRLGNDLMKNLRQISERFP